MRQVIDRIKAGGADFWIGLGLWASAFLIYLRTMPPTVLDGDSGEYQYMAYILGIPHSTGYPLYIYLGKLFTLIPFGDVAYRINLFSAVSAAAAIPVVYGLACLLIPKRIPAVIATALFAVTPSVWGSAVEAKTYALHLVLGTLVLFFAVRWHRDGKRVDLLLLALTFGLGLANHIMIRFVAPALALVLWLNLTQVNFSVSRNQRIGPLPTPGLSFRLNFGRIDRQLLIKSVLLLLLPLLLYAYIPIRASQLIAQQDPANRELYGREDAILKGTITAYYVHSLDGFFNLVSGLDNRQKLDIASPLDKMNRVDLSSSLMMQQFGFAGLLLAVVGVFVSYRRNHKLFAILAVFAGGVGIVAFYLSGISTVFYFSLTYLVISLWIGYGMDAVIDGAPLLRRASSWRVIAFVTTPIAVGLLLATLPLSALILNWPRLDRSRNYGPRNDAQAVLKDDLAQNAVVVAPWEVSQPIRYFQFVENQRSDLLVVNVSPVQKQFETMLTNAQRLKRPFYLVQFTPELKSSSGERFVQAIPIPMPSEPTPRYTLADTRMMNGAQVLGYDISPDPPEPGKSARISVFYRALTRMYPIYSAALSVSDFVGRPFKEIYSIPGSEYYPTYRWQEGNVYRDVVQFIWPVDAPDGLYNLDLSWAIYDLDTRKSDPSTERRVTLGSIRVGNFSEGTIAHTINALVGDGITFLGWTLDSASKSEPIPVKRGQNLGLDLFWRADKSVNDSYTVFVHLANPEGRVFADADGVPYKGLFPTSRWIPGETVRDKRVLALPPNLAPGDYIVEIGMYLAATGERLAIGSEGRRPDKMILTRLRVE